MFFLPKKINDGGMVTPLLVLVIAVGIIGFLLITNTFSFKDNLFSSLYPKPSSNAITSIAFTTTPVDPNKLGVNTSHSTLSPLTIQALDYAKDAGIGWVRGGCDWFEVEPILNKWSFDVCDKYINAASQNFNILELINTPPPACFVALEQISKDSRWRCDLGNYQRYVGAFIKRYKDKIKYWELGNEPDSYRQFGCNNQTVTISGETGSCKGISMPAKYGDLLKIVHKEMKQIDPDANLVIGGLALTNQGPANFNPNFLSLLVNNKSDPILDNIEVMNFHNYGDKGTLKKEIDYIRSLIVSKPIWVSEFGYSSGSNLANTTLPGSNYLKTVYGVGEDGQVNYLSDVVPYALNTLGIDKVFWYTLYDQPDDNQAAFCEDGLLYIQGKQCLGITTDLPNNPNFKSKKVLTTIKNLIKP